MWSKNIRYFKFFQKVLIFFLSITKLSRPLQSQPSSDIIRMPGLFPILETLLTRTFWYCQQLLFRFIFYLLNRSKMLSFHRCVQFWEEEKGQENTVVETRLWVWFWPHVQALMCELVRYHRAKSMIGFPTILCSSVKLFCAIGFYLQGSIPYWQYDLVARIHDAPCHYIHT